MLTSPLPGETLYIYLSTCHEAVSAVLLREQDAVQKPIYFASKVLHGAEVRYPNAEKIILALIVAARKFRPYLQAHPIIVVTDQPLKQILSRLDTSGRASKWAMELAEYDINYKSRTSIKAQALADFLAEGISVEEDLPPAQGWVLYVDGSSSKEGSGAGLLIVNPNGEEMEYALRFDFEATNNEAEYEALIAGLSLARKLGAQQIIAEVTHSS